MVLGVFGCVSLSGPYFTGSAGPARPTRLGPAPFGPARFFSAGPTRPWHNCVAGCLSVSVFSSVWLSLSVCLSVSQSFSCLSVSVWDLSDQLGGHLPSMCEALASAACRSSPTPLQSSWNSGMLATGPGTHRRQAARRYQHSLFGGSTLRHWRLFGHRCMPRMGE